MAFKLPNKATEKIIDLAEFGGEGSLVVRNIQVGDSLELNQFINNKAQKDGIAVKGEKDLERLVTTTYSYDTMIFYITKCVRARDVSGDRPLTEDEIRDLPFDLLMRIMETVNDSTAFPLAQRNGKAPKQERWKPTGEGY